MRKRHINREDMYPYVEGITYFLAHLCISIRIISNCTRLNYVYYTEDVSGTVLDKYT